MLRNGEKSYKDLLKENQLLHTIIDAVSDSVYVVSKDGTILIFNQSCERMEGLKKSNVLGKKDTDVYSVQLEDFQRIAVLNKKRPLLEQHMIYTMNNKKIDAIYNSYPFYENGEITAVYCIGRDMTTINQLLAKYSNLFHQRKSIQNANGTSYKLENIIGTCPSIKQIIREARKVANIKSTVMIYGETGTGKELFAQGIHNASPYSSGPFIAVNCAAIPENLMESLLMGTVKGAFSGALDMPGLFEQSEGGTIFFDEINSLSIHLQAKLLRLLQDQTVRRIGDKTQRRINCRIISASNQDLFEAEKKGQFRADLLYRLTPVVLAIPPLRERLEDIPLLCNFFVNRCNEDFDANIREISQGMLEQFSLYHWPGNVRELEHIIESAMSMTERIDTVLSLDHLPAFIRKQIQKTPITPFNMAYVNEVDRGQSLDEFRRYCEKRFIEDAIQKNHGNVSNTAKQLGITRQNLHYHMRNLGIQSHKY